MCATTTCENLWQVSGVVCAGARAHRPKKQLEQQQSQTDPIPSQRPSTLMESMAMHTKDGAMRAYGRESMTLSCIPPSQ